MSRLTLPLVVPHTKAVMCDMIFLLQSRLNQLFGDLAHSLLKIALHFRVTVVSLIHVEAISTDVHVYKHVADLGLIKPVVTE